MARLLLLIPDLIFSTKVVDAARTLGHETQEVTDTASLIGAAQDGAAAIIIDAQVRLDWQGAVRALKANPATAGIPILAFGPHVDVQTSRAALAAGCDQFVTRGTLARELAKILRNLLA
jgi:CheY-like chemotaxis protein